MAEQRIILIEKDLIQRVLLVDLISGSYGVPQHVVWDEKYDGPFLDIWQEKIGGLVRNQVSANPPSFTLVIDEVKLAAHVAAREAEAASEAARALRVRNAIIFIRNLDISGAMTAAEVQAAVKSLVILARNL